MSILVCRVHNALSSLPIFCKHMYCLRFHRHSPPVVLTTSYRDTEQETLSSERPRNAPGLNRHRGTPHGHVIPKIRLLRSSRKVCIFFSRSWDLPTCAVADSGCVQSCRVWKWCAHIFARQCSVPHEGLMCVKKIFLILTRTSQNLKYDVQLDSFDFLKIQLLLCVVINR